MRALIEARRAATKRCANQRTLLAVDESAEAGSRAGAAADDQRSLSP